MKKDKECKKGKESTIGKIIYGFLLFMPLLTIASNILISTFNNQAKQESVIHYIYETNDVNTMNDIVLNHVYHLDYLSCDDFQTDNNDFISNSINVTILKAESYDGSFDGPYVSETIIDSYDSSKFNSIDLTFMIQDVNFVTVTYGKFSNLNGYIEIGDIFDDSFVIYNIDFCIIDSVSLDTFKSLVGRLPTRSDFNEIDYVETHNLSAENVFYNSIAKIEQSNLFNWVENSIIYTTMSNFTTALSINNTFIPLLLTYWLIISVVYFLYDIVLMILHILHRKIHELQDSI